MLSGQLKSANLALLLVAAVFARALIPLGYMPAGAGGEHWFELCPEGLPPEFAQFLAGTQHHGHQHHDDGNGNGGTAHLCPLGHMLSSAAAVDDTWPAVAAAPVPFPPVIVHDDFTSQPTRLYRSRGPPA